MKSLLVVLAAGFIFGSQDQHAVGKQIVLPNPVLLRCCSSGCSQLWTAEPRPANAIYPVQVIVDLSGEQACARGLVALYDKSVPLDDIRAALDRRYGKWARGDNSTLPVKLWRVEPEAMAIQLTTVTVEPDQSGTAARGTAVVDHEGMKRVIYLPFIGSKCDCR